MPKHFFTFKKENNSNQTRKTQKLATSTESRNKNKKKAAIKLLTTYSEFIPHNYDPSYLGSSFSVALARNDGGGGFV